MICCAFTAHHTLIFTLRNGTSWMAWWFLSLYICILWLLTWPLRENHASLVMNPQLHCIYFVATTYTKEFYCTIWLFKFMPNQCFKQTKFYHSWLWMQISVKHQFLGPSILMICKDWSLTSIQHLEPLLQLAMFLLDCPFWPHTEPMVQNFLTNS
jgi:hypothetical protein